MIRNLFLWIALVMPVFAMAQQQQFTIQGTVYDEKNATLPGANVFIQNTTTGAAADQNGRFSISAPLGANLIVSYVGYEKFEMIVKENVRDLVVTLKPTGELEEVVVTAFGRTQRKISVVGAVTTVDVKELQVPATSMANIIGGRVAGIINMQSSGEPGRNISDFWVRGIGTFGTNDKALVLIDGLEGTLSSLDPADVESFSVLKDASATAVYGVRGANGVVIVTTKRGGEGKLRLTARGNVTFSTLTKMPDYVGAYDYATLLNEALVVRGNQPKYFQRELDIIKYRLDPDLYPDVSWQDEVIKDWGLQHTYYLSGQGGGDIAKYFLSLSMSLEDSAYKMDKKSDYRSGVGYNTYNYRTNLDLKITSSTNLYFGTDGNLSIRNTPGLTNTDLVWQAQAQLTPLLLPTRYSTGELPAYGRDGNSSPYVLLNYTGNKSEQTYSGKMTLAINQNLDMLLDGLSLRIQGAYNNQSRFNESRTVMPEMYWASGRDVYGRLLLAKRVERVAATYDYSQGQSRKYHFESTLNYEKVFAAKHRFSGLLYYYMSDEKDTSQIGTTSGVNRSMSALPRRYQGISSRLSYGYVDTYFLDFNFGFTGSENFQPGRQFGFFPSIAGGWVPTQYNIVREKLPWLTFLKIRGSYGTVGNDRISSRRFPYLTLVNENASIAWASGLAGITESGLGADNLMWEKAIKADVGIEGKLFDNKLSFTIDWFTDLRDGIFQARATIPGYVGLLQMPYGNVGKMKSWGSDGNIAYSHAITKDITFTLRGNYTFSRNKIENWEQAPQKFPYQSYNGYTNGTLRGYKALGLFRDEQDVASSPVQSFGGKVMPGDIKYKDVNGDGVVNTDDMIPLSDPTYPRVMYGFGGEIRYKDITLGVLFKGTGHTPFYHVGQVYNDAIGGMGYVPFHGGLTGNVLTIANDPRNRWIPADYASEHGISPALAENPNARFPRLDSERNANNSQLSTFWQSDGRYLRLQEITLNYHLATDLLRHVGISSADIQLVGSNLHVWDKVKLFDPEQARSNGQVYPIPSRYTLQLYLNF